MTAALSQTLATLRASALPEDLDLLVAGARSRVADLEREREALVARLDALRVGLARRQEAALAEREAVAARCRGLASQLPPQAGLLHAGWAAWISEQLRARGLSMDRRPEPRAQARHLLPSAQKRLRPLLEALARAEALPQADDVPIGEEKEPGARLAELEAAIQARLAALGDRAGRAVLDLPDALDHRGQVGRLELVHAVLGHLELTYGRYAASAALESQMLETLS